VSRLGNKRRVFMTRFIVTFDIKPFEKEGRKCSTQIKFLKALNVSQLTIGLKRPHGLEGDK